MINNTLNTRTFNLLAAGGAWGVKGWKYQNAQQLLGIEEEYKISKSKLGFIKMKIKELERKEV